MELTRVTREQLTNIVNIYVISQSQRSTLYSGYYSDQHIIFEHSQTSIPKNEFAIAEYSDKLKENAIIYRDGDYIIPVLNKQNLSSLVDPYLILFLNSNILNSNEIKNFKGNPYPTLLVYGYFDLISENINYFQAAELGIKESLNTNFYNVYKKDEIEKIPQELINTLIYRGIIIFKNSSGQLVRIHPNISDEINLSEMMLKTIFIENYSKYLLEEEDIQSIMDVNSVTTRSSEDGLFIPPYAKDYIEYVNMNLEDIFSITKGPYTKIDEISDQNIFSWLGIYFLYQNRKDLLKKTNIYLGIEPGNLVFKKKDDICVGMKDKYDIISISEIKDKIKENNSKHDTLLIEILGLLTIYSIEKDEISKLLLKTIRRRSKISSKVWDSVTTLPNVINIRKEYIEDQNTYEFSSFEISYKVDNVDSYLAANSLESMMRKIITKEFSPNNEDPTFIREYINETIHFDITLPYKIDVNKVKNRLLGLEKTQEFREKLGGSKELPIITHMVFKLISPYKETEKLVNNFIKTNLDELVGSNKYTLTSKFLGNTRVEYTITLNILIDKKQLKAKIRELTNTKEYIKIFTK